MTNQLFINKKIESFDKKIFVSGDKSLSIRWVLLASQATGKSKSYNLLMSEDVVAALEAVKKLGIKVLRLLNRERSFYMSTPILMGVLIYFSLTRWLSIY